MEPDTQPEFREEPIHEHLMGLVAALDCMLEDPGLGQLRLDYPAHPAVTRRDALLEIGQRRTLPFTTLIELCIEFALMSFDRDSWLPPVPDPDFWSFLSDPEGAAYVRRSLRDPQKFDETLAEVRVWGQLRNRAGLNASLVEESGLPDIRIDLDENCAWAEVKFVHIDTGRSGIRRQLNKAEQQLKNSNPTEAGVAYIFLETPLSHEHPLAAGNEAPGPDGTLEYDPPDADTSEKIDFIRHFLATGRYPHIGVAVAVWLEGRISTDQTGAGLLIQRRAKMLLSDEALPRNTPPLEVLRPGGWAFTRLGTATQGAR